MHTMAFSIHHGTMTILLVVSQIHVAKSENIDHSHMSPIHVSSSEKPDDQRPNGHSSKCTLEHQPPWGFVQNCSNCGLSGIPLPPRDTAAAVLDIGHNPITEIGPHAFQDYEELVLLYLSGAYNVDMNEYTLSELAFAGLSKLRVLKIENGVLEYIPERLFIGLVSLEKLVLKNIELKSVSAESLSVLPSLRFLDLSDNLSFNPMSGNVSNLPDIEYLNVQGNLMASDIIKLLSALPHLKHVDLGGNFLAISVVESFPYLPLLEFLSMRDNLLSDIIYETFTSYPNVVHLDLSENFLQNISNGTFQELRNLESLYLRDNQFEVIETGKFEVLSGLRRLALDGNHLTALTRGVFRGLSNLVELSLSDNKLSCIECGVFAGLQFLEILLLDDNSLYTVIEDSACEQPIQSKPTSVFTELTALTDLDLSDNDLYVVDDGSFSGLSSLLHLSLKNNHVSNIEKFAFDTPSLVWLDLSFNTLESVVLSLPSLTHLSLTNNYFAVFNSTHFDGLPQLTVLSLEDNMIVQISIDEGSSFPYLNTLFLGDNDIEVITEIVKSAPSLRELYIDNNNISLVSEQDVNYLRNLEKFSAMGKPFTCSCDLESFVEWLFDNNTRTLQIGFDRYFCDDSDTELSVVLSIDCSLPLLLNMTAIVSIPTVAVLALALSVGLGYYYRWTIRWYWYRMRIRHYRHQEIQADYDPALEFDAFIAYSSLDYRFVLTELLPHLENPPEGEAFKVAVDFREFVPGHVLTDEIITYMDKSRKTIILLNNNFIDGNWTLFEYEMAKSKLAKRRDVIIVVLLEDISNRMSDLPMSLNELLKERLYIEWSTDPQGRELFWKKLRLALKKSSAVRTTRM